MLTATTPNSLPVLVDVGHLKGFRRFFERLKLGGISPGCRIWIAQNLKTKTETKKNKELKPELPKRVKMKEWLEF